MRLTQTNFYLLGFLIFLLAMIYSCMFLGACEYWRVNKTPYQYNARQAN